METGWMYNAGEMEDGDSPASEEGPKQCLCRDVQADFLYVYLARHV